MFIFRNLSLMWRILREKFYSQKEFWFTPTIGLGIERVSQVAIIE
jgi:hypothetical protein